jgi:hypothetical protein
MGRGYSGYKGDSGGGKKSIGLSFVFTHFSSMENR